MERSKDAGYILNQSKLLMSELGIAMNRRKNGKYSKVWRSWLRQRDGQKTENIEEWEPDPKDVS